MNLDIDYMGNLLSTFHASLNVPNTANIQREILDEIKQINDDLAVKVQPQPGFDEQGRPIPRAYPGEPTDDLMSVDGPETGTDNSGESQGTDPESLPQETRRL